MVMQHFFEANSEYHKQGANLRDGIKLRPTSVFRELLKDYLIDDFGVRSARDFGLIDEDVQSPTRQESVEAIPFYFDSELRPNAQGQDVVKNFGFAEVYPLPHDCSVSEIAAKRPENTLAANQFDWTECLFGKADAKNSDDNDASGTIDTEATSSDISIGSRLSFSFAQAITSEDPKMCDDEQAYVVVQGQPKLADALYLSRKNPANRTPVVWDGENTVLNGHKRYPAVHEKLHQGDPNFGLGMPPSIAHNCTNTQSLVRPLKKGAVFHLEIDFHNLHPLELGALLWSVSFGDRLVFGSGSDTTFRHVAGRLRANGLGRLKVLSCGFQRLDQNPDASGAGARLLVQRCGKGGCAGNCI